MSFGIRTSAALAGDDNNFTAVAYDRCIIAMQGRKSATAAPVAKWGGAAGQTMTLIRNYAAQGMAVSMWYLNSPAIGVNQFWTDAASSDGQVVFFIQGGLVVSITGSNDAFNADNDNATLIVTSQVADIGFYGSIVNKVPAGFAGATNGASAADTQSASEAGAAPTITAISYQSGPDPLGPIIVTGCSLAFVEAPTGSQGWVY